MHPGFTLRHPDSSRPSWKICLPGSFENMGLSWGSVRSIWRALGTPRTDHRMLTLDALSCLALHRWRVWFHITLRKQSKRSEPEWDRSVLARERAKWGLIVDNADLLYMVWERRREEEGRRRRKKGKKNIYDDKGRVRTYAHEWTAYLELWGIQVLRLNHSATLPFFGKERLYETRP